MTTGTEQLYREKGDTWPKVLKYNYGKYGDTHRAMRHKHHGIWQPYTWKDYYFNVKSLALGLISLGLEPGDKMLIVGDNAPEWYYAVLAAQANHGVSVGLYSELIPQEIAYIAQSSEARFAVVEGQEQVDKFLQIKDELPLLQKVIYWSYKGLAHYNEPLLIGYREAVGLGQKYEEEHPGLFEKNVETGREEDVCAIVYTSGTTEVAPKGAVHTYRTMRAGAETYLRLDPWYDGDNVVPYLPPVWMNEQWLCVGCHLMSASTLNFAEGPETQQRDTSETEPSIIFYGARLWESQAATVLARVHSAGAVNRLAFRLLMPMGYNMAELKYKKRRPGLWGRILHALVDRVLFKPIRRSMGLENARICYSTGAMLSPDAFKLYHALNLPLKSLYGTTEGGPLSGAQNEDVRPGTVGPPHQGTEVKITDEGEIVYRHPGTFIGYFGNSQRTAEVLKEGWFHSGDSGFIEEDGHLVFVDRVKDLVEMENGEKLAPQLAESRLRFSPYIKDAWVFAGPNRAYASAVIIIDYDNVSRWAGQRRIAYTTFTELAQRPEVYDLIRQDIDRVNQTMPPRSRVRKYVNLHKELSPDEGELTRNRKLRRTFLEEQYRELIDAIYHDKSEVPIEVRAGSREGRMGTTEVRISIRSLEGGA